eukprot:scaffold1954_cov268-Pinguiococcus_pyrenoidosus.AAC.276
MLREFNDNPDVDEADFTAGVASPPRHLRIFFTSDLVAFAEQGLAPPAVDASAGGDAVCSSVEWGKWKAFWAQANEEARIMRWTEKGIDLDEADKPDDGTRSREARKIMTWTAPGAGWTDLAARKLRGEEGLPYAHVENDEDESRRIDLAGDAYATLTSASLIVGMHPDQAAGGCSGEIERCGVNAVVGWPRAISAAQTAFHVARRGHRGLRHPTPYPVRHYTMLRVRQFVS